ncbi:MAG: hypothetical protein J3R72DRAFT_450264 [Linnemannia gamsii]|nr:MAG: hypothetical protein J3R72DRAFT_450264 [Linnemannia gamsii]
MDYSCLLQSKSAEPNASVASRHTNTNVRRLRPIVCRPLPQDGNGGTSHIAPLFDNPPLSDLAKHFSLPYAPPPPTMRREKRPRQFRSPEASALRVLNFMKQNGHSLLSLVKCILWSRNPDIVARLHRFYHDNGPSFLINHWTKEFAANAKNAHYGKPITVAATKMVVDRAQENLVGLAKLPDPRMPAKSLTGAEIRAFSFDKIDYHLATSASTLNQLLHGLTGFQINEDAPPSAKLSDKHEPEFVATLASMLLHNRSQTSNIYSA